MKRDNDIIRALGFVALNSAYVEESVDEVMERLSLVNERTEKERKFPTSQKIKWCIKTLDSFNNENLNDLVDLLNEAKDSLEQRNEVIHGRIYAGNDRSENLKSGRSGIPDREVTTDELYDLAEHFHNLQAAIPNVSYFETMRSIAEKNNA